MTNENINPKVKILVGYHKPATLIKNEIFTPIHLGRDLATQASKDGEMSQEDFDWMCENMIGDNTGENISYLNRYFCELTGIYWAWKNYDKLGNPDYIGFAHYRRLLFNNKEYSTNKNMQFPFANLCYVEDNISFDDSILKGLQVLAPFSENVKDRGYKNLKDQFANSSEHNIKDLELAISYIENNYPEMKNLIQKYFNGGFGYFYNMFILTKKNFMDYCRFIFELGMQLYKFIKKERSIAYVLERVTGFYLYYRKHRNEFAFREFPVAYIQNTSIIKPLDLVFSENYTPIVLCSDDNYAPYTAVAIQSIINNMRKKYNLDIVIFSSNISIKSKNMILDLKSKNISIRFYDINDSSDFFVHGHFSKVTYYRFYISEVMQKYKKVIYLDSDIICNADIEELYSINFDESLMASRAIGVVYWYNKDSFLKEVNCGIKEYWDKILKLHNPSEYFNAGVLVINIAKFREQDILKKLLKATKEIKNPPGVDQDIFNYVLKGNVKFLDNKWNFTKEPKSIEKDLKEWLPENLYELYKTSEQNFHLIHYADRIKPWNSSSTNFFNLWWMYAKHSPFYETLLYKFAILEQEKAFELLDLEQKEIELNTYNFTNKSREINIVFVCDHRSVKKCAVSMLSALNNKNELDYIKFYFIYDEKFTKEELECLDIFNTSCSSITLCQVESKDFVAYKNTTQRKAMPLNAYYRLHIPWILSKEDRAIYIDYDTIVNDSLWDIYNLNIDNYYLAAVDDPWKYGRYRQMMHIQPESRHYNSGMMVINCKKWRQENIKDKFIEFSKNHKDVFVLADQFLINTIINKNVLYLSLEWNLQLARKEWNEKLEFDDDNELKNATENPKIIHYNFGKPWQFNACFNPFFHLWWKEARKLPFYQDILKNALSESLKVHNIEKSIGAVERIKNQLSYRLGYAIVSNIKNPLKMVMIPSSIMKSVKEYRQYKNKTKHIVFQPLETYADYEECLKVQNHLSYRIGKTILSANKQGLKGFVKLPYSLFMEIRQFKNKKYNDKVERESEKPIVKFSLEDDENFLKERHKNIFGYLPDFKRPKTFSEKIISRMLYDRSSIYTVLADKLKVRLYVYQKTIKSDLDMHFFSNESSIFYPIDSLEEELYKTNKCPYLPKLYGIYKNAYDIDFDKLPNSFVLKTNHDSGGVVVVEDKKEFIRDTEKFYTSMQKLQTHLQRNYYYFAREWQYFNMEPRIFAEELLIGDNGKPADTYKFHIFDQNNDKNNFIQVTTDRFDNYQRVMLNSDWSLAPFGISYDNSKIVNIPAQPFMLKEMFDLAYNLASLFDYVRVDLYQNKNNIYFGELTFTPGAAGERIIPNEWDERLGELWKRKEIINEASK
ncbi:DUF4422 domain-containing protein [Campylobacter coli]